jgi:hypothetical protein
VGSSGNNSEKQSKNQIQRQQGSINEAFFKLLADPKTRTPWEVSETVGFCFVWRKSGVIKSIKIVIEQDCKDKP